MRYIPAALITFFLTAVGFCATAAVAPALERGEFGWRSGQIVGRRPLLVIWVHEPDDTRPSELARYEHYFADTVFGRALTTAERLRYEPSVVGYFQEASGGKFTFTRAGFIGPLNLSIKGKEPDEVARLALAAAANEGKFDFKTLDRNHDGRITPNELAVLLIVNAAANRHRQEFVGPSRAFDIPGQDVAFAGRLAMVAERDGLATVNRELFHIIAPVARDLDGAPDKCFTINRGLTLMAAVDTSNPQQTLHPDPWHKMMAGWIEPRVFTVGAPGKARLAAQSVSLPADAELRRPVLIYDPARGKSEFFLLEYRTRSVLGFDQDLAGHGLVIWHVILDAANKPFNTTADRPNCKGEKLPIETVFVRGAPDWQLGGTKLYGPSNGPVVLKWMDGTDSGIRVSIPEYLTIRWAIDISWTATATPVAHAAE
jgi:hypothetical protein